MLNHKRPQQTAWEYKDSRGGFVIESKEEIRRGEQVFDSYGKKCNSRFFLNYGFIVEDNDANEVPILVALDLDDPLLEVKRKILGVIDCKKIRVSEDLSEKNMHNFFGFLRFSLFRGDPMKLYNYQFQQNVTKKSEDEEEQPYEGTNIPPLTIENEKAVLVRIQSLAHKQLAAYPTTYEADLKILEESKDLAWNNRNALLMRSGEKKVLLFLIELSRLGLELIELPLKKAKEVFNKRPDKARFEKYITQSLFVLMHSVSPSGKKHHPE